MSEQTLTLILMLILLGAVLYAVQLRGRLRETEHRARRDAMNADLMQQRLEQELSNLRRPIPPTLSTVSDRAAARRLNELARAAGLPRKHN